MHDSLEIHDLLAPQAIGEKPSRASGLQLLGEMAGSGYRQPPLLVRRGDGQTVQITPLLYRVLEAIDGHRDHAALADTVSDRVGRLLTADDIRFLVEHKLVPLGLLRGPDGTEPATVKSNPLLGLRFRLMISSPRVTRRLTSPFAWLFHPGVTVSVVVAFAFVSWWVLFHKGLGTAVEEALYQPRLILVLIGLTLLSAAFHELGHATACRHGGAEPGAMGAALYLIWPVFYTDVTDSYRLGRAGRLRVDLGGLYFNAIFTLATVGLWAVVRTDALLVVVPIQLLQMARQLIPLVRFDGYHILADLVGVPDLFARIRPILRAMVPGRRRTTDPNPLKPWARFVVSGWVLMVVPVLAVMLGLAVWNLPQVATSAWDSLGLQAGALRASVSDRNVDRILLGLVSIVAVALLPVSMAYLTARILRLTTVRLWIATEGHPAPRGLALLVAVALVAGTGSQWWPERREAETIQQASPAPPSTGTLLAGAAGDKRPSPHRELVALQGPVSATLASGPLRADGPKPGALGADVTADIGSGRRRAHEHSAGDGAQVGLRGPTEGRIARPAWPFPFDPPPRPGKGDNHALAVNTSDGTSVVESAFSLRWLPAGPLLQTNRADALASCIDCKTVAVAFQVLIADGPSGPVAPQNLAVAANSECTACLTRAVAVQLVVSLERSPSKEARNEIATWWKRLGALERDIDNLSPDQIHARLLEIRSAISQILAPYGQALPLASDISKATSDDTLEELETAPPEVDDPADDPAESVVADEVVGGEDVDDEPTIKGAARADQPADEERERSGKAQKEKEPVPEQPSADDEQPVDGTPAPEEASVPEEAVRSGVAPSAEPTTTTGGVRSLSE